MKLGFLTACFPELKFEDLVRRGSKEVFQMVELVVAHGER
jgi:hypothetical protein